MEIRGSIGSAGRSWTDITRADTSDSIALEAPTGMRGPDSTKSIGSDSLGRDSKLFMLALANDLNISIYRRRQTTEKKLWARDAARAARELHGTIDCYEPTARTAITPKLVATSHPSPLQYSLRK